MYLLFWCISALHRVHPGRLLLPRLQHVAPATACPEDKAGKPKGSKTGVCLAWVAVPIWRDAGRTAGTGPIALPHAIYASVRRARPLRLIRIAGSTNPWRICFVEAGVEFVAVAHCVLFELPPEKKNLKAVPVNFARCRSFGLRAFRTAESPPDQLRAAATSVDGGSFSCGQPRMQSRDRCLACRVILPTSFVRVLCVDVSGDDHLHPQSLGIIRSSQRALSSRPQAPIARHVCVSRPQEFPTGSSPI